MLKKLKCLYKKIRKTIYPLEGIEDDCNNIMRIWEQMGLGNGGMPGKGEEKMWEEINMKNKIKKIGYIVEEFEKIIRILEPFTSNIADKRYDIIIREIISCKKIEEKERKQFFEDFYWEEINNKK